jgi:autotransporter translocation and assembly factor TamB
MGGTQTVTLDANATDASGTITLTSTATGTAASTCATVTFNATWADRSALPDHGGESGRIRTERSGAVVDRLGEHHDVGFVIKSNTALVAGTYIYNYDCYQ